MMPVRLVAPFRPFPTEGIPHAEVLQRFDWHDALRMLSASAYRACGVPVTVLTDVDTVLPMPSLRYATHRRSLMLWYLEIAACYLESDDFACDTIALDADQLLYDDLTKWLAVNIDLGILVRPLPKGLPGLPILNGVQFWPVRNKTKLAAFYRRALAVAETLTPAEQQWGADTIALERLLSPFEPMAGIAHRCGLRVFFIPADDVITPFSSTGMARLAAGTLTRPHCAVLDFRAGRKPYMRAVFDATIGAEAEDRTA